MCLLPAATINCCESSGRHGVEVNDRLRGQRPSSSTPEKSPGPHHHVSPIESCPRYTLGPRSTRTPSHHKDPGAPGHHHTTRTQEHLDAITPQGPRNTQTPLQHKPHAGTQEHQTPLD
ncbi:hypothetical protein STEG23_032808 [Scotinomys teguina]